MTLRNAAVAAIAAGIFLLFTLLPAMRVPVAVAMIVILPGFLLAMAFMGERVSGAEGLLLILLLSMCAVVAGGLAMGVVGFQITATSWWFFLLLLAAGAGGVAVLRRLGRGPAIPLRLPRTQEVVYLAAGLVLISFALNIATIGARDARTPGGESLPQLWMLPDDEDTNGVRVGVDNLGATTGFYRLELLVNGVAADSRMVTVDGGQSWVHRFPLRGVVERVDVLLYSEGASRAIRHAWRMLPG